MKPKRNKRNARNKKSPLTPEELEVSRESRWLKTQKETKKKIENTNNDYMTMAHKLSFTLINHSNIRFESDYPPAQLIPLLKSFFRGKANKSIAESIAKLIDTYSVFFMVGPVNNVDYSKAFDQSKSNFQSYIYLTKDTQL